MPTHKTKPIDRFFLISLILLTGFGFMIFLSASLGLLAEGSNFSSIALKQGISLLIGIGFFWFFSRLPYQKIRSVAFFVFLGAVILNLLLFIPGLTLYHGGATRWIDLRFISFQPSEFLKFAFIIYLAAWAYYAKDRIKTFKHGLLPYGILMLILAALLYAQSDLDTLVIIGFTGFLMLIVAGLSWKQVVVAGVAMSICLAGIIMASPHALVRIQTYFDHSSDVSGAGYQVNQSLIAIGSGGLAGRGFGQSIQKFGYLPEPIGDSVFAVAAEEFGFIGSILLLLLYMSLAWSAFRIGTRAPDIFGGLLAVGIAILIITESFINMSAMLGIIPLSGLPLLFISHGGTALIIVLAASGIVANVSRSVRDKV
jgi:cell division protein FtsW